jgi:hypothetical protein
MTEGDRVRLAPDLDLGEVEQDRSGVVVDVEQSLRLDEGDSSEIDGVAPGVQLRPRELLHDIKEITRNRQTGQDQETGRPHWHPEVQQGVLRKCD